MVYKGKRSFRSLFVSIFTIFKCQDFYWFWTYFWILEDRVLHKGAWVATLLGTLFGVQDYKKVKFPVRDTSFLVGVKYRWHVAK